MVSWNLAVGLEVEIRFVLSAMKQKRERELLVGCCMRVLGMVGWDKVVDSVHR